MSDAELLDEAKRLRYAPVTHAVIIGLLVGIIGYSIVKGTFGLLMAIPLYMLYRLITAPNAKRLREVKGLIEARKVK